MTSHSLEQDSLKGNVQKRALIFGASSQAGHYLRQLLLEKGYEVWGTYFDHREFVYSGTNMMSCDVRSRDSVGNTFRQARPDEVYNLASKMFAPRSWEDPENYTATCYNAVVHMLDHIWTWNPGIKFFNAGSAEVFDISSSPQSEVTPLRPRNPYGVAKAAAQELVRIYRSTKGLYACTGIFFNMESPLRAPSFFSRKVVTEVVRIKRELDRKKVPIEKMQLGKLDALRDWGYTKEYMEAAHLMLQQERPDDYVIATGEAHSCADFVEEAFEAVGMSWPECINYFMFEKPGGQQDLLLGNPTKIYEKLGWKAKTRFNALVRYMVAAELEDKEVVHGGGQ